MVDFRGQRAQRATTTQVTTGCHQTWLQVASVHLKAKTNPSKGSEIRFPTIYQVSLVCRMDVTGDKTKYTSESNFWGCVYSESCHFNNSYSLLYMKDESTHGII